MNFVKFVKIYVVECVCENTNTFEVAMFIDKHTIFTNVCIVLVHQFYELQTRMSAVVDCAHCAIFVLCTFFYSRFVFSVLCAHLFQFCLYLILQRRSTVFEINVYFWYSKLFLDSNLYTCLWRHFFFNIGSSFDVIFGHVFLEFSKINVNFDFIISAVEFCRIRQFSITDEYDIKGMIFDFET